jgi:hypothetical protein
MGKTIYEVLFGEAEDTSKNAGGGGGGVYGRQGITAQRARRSNEEFRALLASDSAVSRSRSLSLSPPPPTTFGLYWRLKQPSRAAGKFIDIGNYY